MNGLHPLECFIAKQTCRSFAYKYDISSNPNEKPSNLYTLPFLKTLHDSPNDNINKILLTALLCKDEVFKKSDCYQPNKIGDENDYNIFEKGILLDYFKRVNDMKSTPVKQWTDLQHYLCFVYRYCMRTDPDPEQEVLSPYFISDMRNIVCGLMAEDEIQLCLRMFSLVREYTIFALKQYQKIKSVEQSIESLFYYYESFLSATKNICKIFPELEKLLLNTYKLGWLDFNTSIFMCYFYETNYVQNMMREFEQKKVSIKAARIYTVIIELHKLWKSQMSGIKKFMTNKDNLKLKNLEGIMMASHKRILSKNFWIDRTSEEKSIQDLKVFDHQLFMLVGDKNLVLPEPTLDELGQCICEDCLIIKYRSLLENNQNKIGLETMKFTCRFCKQQFDNFQQHIKSIDVGQSLFKPSTNLSRIISEKIDLFKLGINSNSEPTSSSNNRATKKQSRKLPENINSTTATTTINTNHDHLGSYCNNVDRKLKQRFSSTTSKSSSAKMIVESSTVFKDELLDNEVAATKLEIQEFIRNGKCDQLSSKTIRKFFKIKNQMTKNGKENLDLKLFDKSSSTKSTSKGSATTESSIKANDLINGKDVSTAKRSLPCGHDCKHSETELKSSESPSSSSSSTKKGNHHHHHHDTSSCDHHKESKKCECTFCEVFGTSSHVHKTNETRNRLRIRLNQRNGGNNNIVVTNNNKNSKTATTSTGKGIATTTTPVTTTTTKLPQQQAVNKNINTNNNPVINNNKSTTNHKTSTTELSSSNSTSSSITNGCVVASNKLTTDTNLQSNNIKEASAKSSSTNNNNINNNNNKSTSIISSDVHRLLNYIEGNGNDGPKVALAEKKAAKKARQRMKKEQERFELEEIERKRVLEEKRVEQEKLRNEELARQLAERTKQQELKKENKSKKKQLKNSNKLAARNAASAAQQLMEEETIPAMVTIKRVVENQNVLPTVTITLKGSTPDQDKLLYKLVNGHNKHDNNNDRSNKINNNTNGVDLKKLSNKNNNNTKKNNNKNKNNNNFDISQMINFEVNNSTIITTSNNGSLNKKKKNKGSVATDKSNTISKELRVTLAVDNKITNYSDNNKSANNKLLENSKNNISQIKSTKKKDGLVVNNSKKTQQSNLNIPMLRLPPGITITKVDGPMNDRNYKTCNNNDNQSYNSNIPVSKSGVIVVDTEKLIKQSSVPSSSSSVVNNANNINNNTTSSKKSRRKKTKKQQQQQQQTTNTNIDNNCNNNNISTGETFLGTDYPINGSSNKQSSMITLKNPIFHPNMNQTTTTRKILKSDNNNESEIINNGQQFQQAAIFKNANGMVTIRSSRLQHSLSNGTPLPNLLSDLKPVLGPDVSSSITATVALSSPCSLSSTSSYMSACSFSSSSDQHVSHISNSSINNNNTAASNRISSFNNAQEILSGLPGIEITKVDKNATKSDLDHRKANACHTAEVSIIPTNCNNGSSDKLSMDKDDWHYDSVFTPKDILEDDMDAEERELEAFKRFCQQSVPPKQKEKVAHLNVKDIILKKKNDKTTAINNNNNNNNSSTSS